MTVDKDLTGKNAVVTGASSGIGRAIALELAAAGACLVIQAKSNQEGLQQTKRLIAETETTALLCDLSELESCDSFVNDCYGELGNVDIWINNAGADVLTGPPSQLSFEEKMDRLWSVDVRGTIHLARAVGTKMVAFGGGAILNMGWDQALIGQAGDSGEMFAATKGAIMSFSLSLARTLAPLVRVNCLAPGWIRTDWGASAPNHWEERAKGESLLERWGTVEDVARVARFLVSPAASFVNGQIIPVNGGCQPWPARLTRDHS